MLIDTHCHLDYLHPKFNVTDVLREAREKGVSQYVCVAIGRENFSTVIELAGKHEGVYFALGIHPVYIDQAKEEDLTVLEELIEKHINHPKFCAIGEIGLDYYVESLKKEPLLTKQKRFFEEQLKLAVRYNLPVLVHSRRSNADVIRLVKKHRPTGIMHAFSGSIEEANQLIRLGFKISLCGTVTYDNARKKTELAKALPADSIVIETDSPDLPPAGCAPKENTPAQLPVIASAIADIRGVGVKALSEQVRANTLAVLERLRPE